MWKRKLEAEAPEAAIFHGSGKREMNGSGSSKKIFETEATSFKKLEAEAEALHVEAEAIKNSPLPHYCLQHDATPCYVEPRHE